jgi:hypothetical protein
MLPIRNQAGGDDPLFADAVVEDFVAGAHRRCWPTAAQTRWGARMEVWIENTGMVELLTPAFATEYLTLTRRRGAHGA